MILYMLLENHVMIPLHEVVRVAAKRDFWCDMTLERPDVRHKPAIEKNTQSKRISSNLQWNRAVET
jgi:hypothetical protein